MPRQSPRESGSGRSCREDRPNSETGQRSALKLLAARDGVAARAFVELALALEACATDAALHAVARFARVEHAVFENEPALLSLSRLSAISPTFAAAAETEERNRDQPRNPSHGNKVTDRGVKGSMRGRLRGTSVQRNERGQ